MAIHDRTAFAQRPDLATQVGFIVEGWTYVERVLRDVIVQGSPPPVDEDEIASRLFHIGDLRKEIAEARKHLDGYAADKAGKLDSLLEAFDRLLDDRNAIIHGWYLGPSEPFGVELHHFQVVKEKAGRASMSADQLRYHRRKHDASEFVSAHLTALSGLIAEAGRVLHPA